MILYFTGTGNIRYIARKVASDIRDEKNFEIIALLRPLISSKKALKIHLFGI